MADKDDEDCKNTIQSCFLAELHEVHPPTASSELKNFFVTIVMFVESRVRRTTTRRVVEMEDLSRSLGANDRASRANSTS